LFVPKYFLTIILNNGCVLKCQIYIFLTIVSITPSFNHGCVFNCKVGGWANELQTLLILDSKYWYHLTTTRHLLQWILESTWWLLGIFQWWCMKGCGSGQKVHTNDSLECLMVTMVFSQAFVLVVGQNLFSNQKVIFSFNLF